MIVFFLPLIVYHDVMSTKTQAKMSMLIDVSPSTISDTGYGYNTLWSTLWIHDIVMDSLYGKHQG